MVFNSPEVNAFALPGGKVGVYTGLLQLAESDAELATALGHEIGHVIARPGAERMSEAIILAGVGELATSTVESKTDQNKRQLFELASGGLIAVARVLPHLRARESEADQNGRGLCSAGRLRPARGHHLLAENGGATRGRGKGGHADWKLGRAHFDPSPR